jgi:Ca-activated chloride channel family protein
MKNGTGYGNVFDYNLVQDAVSRIDEENLKKLSEELGITYINMNNGNAGLQGVVSLIKDSAMTVIETGDGAEVEKDIYYFFAIPLAILLILEIYIVTLKGRM